MDTDIKQVTENVYGLQFILPNAGSMLTAYFIVGERGALIDPGPAAAVPLLQEAMKQLGIKELSYIIPTHIHLDHAGSLGSLAPLYPDAKIVVHPAAAKHVVSPSRLIESTRMVFGQDFEAHYGPILPVPPSMVETPEDNETIHACGRGLQIIYAPGHASHHIALFDRERGELFCGEALGTLRPGCDSTPLPNATPGFDPEVYLNTVAQLKKLQPRLLIHSHYGVSREPDALIAKLITITKTVGDIVLKALREGKTADAIQGLLQAYYSSSYGVEWGKLEMLRIVQGYAAYYRKAGLIA